MNTGEKGTVARLSSVVQESYKILSFKYFSYFFLFFFFTFIFLLIIYVIVECEIILLSEYGDIVRCEM